MRKQLELKTIYPFLVLLTIYVAGYVIAIPLAVKLIALGPLVFPGGYIAASVTYPCTDIAHEIYGKKYANAIVTCGFVGILIMLLLVQVDLILPSPGFWTLEKSYNDVFGMSIRITIAGIVAFLLGQYADVYFFSKIKKKTGNKHLWFRNNFSTALSKLLDTVSFNYIAFWGIYEKTELFYMTVCSYLIYLLIAILDTPLVYLGVWLIKKHLKNNS